MSRLKLGSREKAKVTGTKRSLLLEIRITTRQINRQEEEKREQYIISYVTCDAQVMRHPCVAIISSNIVIKSLIR